MKIYDVFFIQRPEVVTSRDNYFNALMQGTISEEILSTNSYKFVAVVEAECPDDIYIILQNYSEEWWKSQKVANCLARDDDPDITNARSMMIGDYVVDRATNRRYGVAFVGFKEF